LATGEGVDLGELGKLKMSGMLSYVQSLVNPIQDDLGWNKSVVILHRINIMYYCTGCYGLVYFISVS